MKLFFVFFFPFFTRSANFKQQKMNTFLLALKIVSISFTDHFALSLEPKFILFFLSFCSPTSYSTTNLELHVAAGICARL